MYYEKSIKEIENSLEEILKNDTNNIITISSSDKDIKNLAERLNIELKILRKKQLQYENGNQEIKSFITNISHDLRTPLTAISGYVELLKKQNVEKKENKYLEVIERKTNDLTNLTEQIFDFSKTMDIGIKLQKENTCINTLLEEAIANYYIIFKENNITPKINITEEKIYQTVDKNTIIRVFENILSNAIKYTKGKVEITLNEKGKVIFSNEAEELDVVSVEKIFNRYYTIENAKASTGLGLFIAKQLIELNGGKISAKYKDKKLIIEIIF